MQKKLSNLKVSIEKYFQLQYFRLTLIGIFWDIDPLRFLKDLPVKVNETKKWRFNFLGNFDLDIFRPTRLVKYRLNNYLIIL